jgi:hypothetical protein
MGLLVQFLLGDIFPEFINHKIVKPVFAVVVALLFIAPQVRKAAVKCASEGIALWAQSPTRTKATAGVRGVKPAASSEECFGCLARCHRPNGCVHKRHALCPPLQDRDHNFCLSLFWNYWWPLMFVIYPFLGRIW